jgi:DNA polymerase/3'-5' exonuclease PolX
MTTPDYKNVIISELKAISTQERLNHQKYKVQAYNKVISQIEKLPFIRGFDDLVSVSGIGEGIRGKISEIFRTGQLQAAGVARDATQVYEQFLGIHGVGINKAEELVQRYGITSIDQLRTNCASNCTLLNSVQQIGLKYYDDLKSRIPRDEMDLHALLIYDFVRKTNPKLRAKMVGSYRRGLLDSGDIDLLMYISGSAAPTTIAQQSDEAKIFNQLIVGLRFSGYIIDDLAVGSKKFLGVCRLKGKSARRIDILMTNQEEYPFAALYFTGERQLNIEMRKRANEIGYTLSEYGMRPSTDRVETQTTIKSEEDIFTFLGYRYLDPTMRLATNLVRFSASQIQVDQIFNRVIERITQRVFWDFRA